MTTKNEIYELLTDTFDKLCGLHGQCDGLSADSAFAIGFAAGSISRAKALVGRDIDDTAQNDN